MAPFLVGTAKDPWAAQLQDYGAEADHYEGVLTLSAAAVGMSPQETCATEAGGNLQRVKAGHDYSAMSMNSL